MWYYLALGALVFISAFDLTNVISPPAPMEILSPEEDEKQKALKKEALKQEALVFAKNAYNSSVAAAKHSETALNAARKASKTARNVARKASEIANDKYCASLNRFHRKVFKLILEAIKEGNIYLTSDGGCSCTQLVRDKHCAHYGWQINRGGNTSYYTRKCTQLGCMDGCLSPLICQFISQPETTLCFDCYNCVLESKGHSKLPKVLDIAILKEMDSRLEGNKDRVISGLLTILTNLPSFRNVIIPSPFSFDNRFRRRVSCCNMPFTWENEVIKAVEKTCVFMFVNMPADLVMIVLEYVD
jgi:hypothetical protein